MPQLHWSTHDLARMAAERVVGGSPDTRPSVALGHREVLPKQPPVLYGHTGRRQLHRQPVRSGFQSPTPPGTAAATIRSKTDAKVWYLTPGLRSPTTAGNLQLLHPLGHVPSAVSRASSPFVNHKEVQSIFSCPSPPRSAEPSRANRGSAFSPQEFPPGPPHSPYYRSGVSCSPPASRVRTAGSVASSLHEQPVRGLTPQPHFFGLYGDYGRAESAAPLIQGRGERYHELNK